MKKYLLALAAVLVLCVPAFADSPHFASDSLNVSSSTSQYNMTFSGSDIYLYATEGGLYFASLTQNATCFMSGTFANGSEYTHTYYADRSFSGDYVTTPAFYAGLAGFPESAGAMIYNPSVAIYPSGIGYDVIYGDLIDFISSGSGGEGSVASSLTVPRGNVLYFQVESNSDVNFVSHFSENSGLFSSGNVYGPWGDTYQRISSEASLPGPGIEFPRAGSDAIVWDKGEPLNVLGQTKVGVFTKSCTSGTYYAFYNPAYQSISTSDGFGSTSVGSNVTVSGDFSFIRIYSLQQLLDISTSTDNYDTYYVGTPDGDGGVTWVDQDDQVSYPSSGGENQEDEPISSVSLIESIKRILHNILSEIESIFTFGFSAIRDLVDLMDEFVATFDDLYEWLPEECYTLLIGCVSVAIVIGVFKVFL